MTTEPTPPAPEPTPEEIEIVRDLQHLYCDCWVDGVPTGDLHIEATPAQAARRLRIYVRAQLAAKEAEIGRLREALEDVLNADETTPAATLDRIAKQARAALQPHQTERKP